MGKFWARISNSVFKWLPWGIKALAFPRVSHMKYFNLLLTSRLGAWQDWALSAAPLEWGLLTCTWKNSTFESQHYWLRSWWQGAGNSSVQFSQVTPVPPGACDHDFIILSPPSVQQLPTSAMINKGFCLNQLCNPAQHKGAGKPSPCLGMQPG